ncbi:MAG: response regulator, partial [Proteobacteria bacterium]|nr:response regulator [Pseudomonadota bacterium]
MTEKRIIIVNPDVQVCDSMEETLSLAGYLSYTAANCLEAEKLARILIPHIAILSETLPDGMGMDLLGIIREAAPDCHFIIIRIKGSNDEQIPIALKGSLSYLTAPQLPETLLKAVTHAFEISALRKEKMNTESSLRKRNRELENINNRLHQIVESTRRLTSFSGTGDICPVILHEFAGNMNAQGGSLYLHKNNELVLACSLDSNHAQERIPLPLSNNSVMSHVLSKNEPILIEDIYQENSLRSSGWAGYSDKSLLAFPLLEKHGDIVGIITLHNKTNPPFTKQDRELGSILASYGSETLRATQAIENLKQSEEKARIILEANPDPVVVLDNEQKVRYFNPAFTRVFGWSLEELIDRPMDSFQPKSTRSKEHINHGNERFSGIETLRYSKSGELIPVSISGAMFSDNSGKVLGSVCNFRDITSQKTLESQLIQSQKMEAIGTLASGIAHDFNNILSAIFGNLDLALMDLPEDASHRKNIENIHKAAHRAKNLVSQILSVSRKKDKTQEDTQKIHPHLIIKEALFLLRASLPSTIEIHETYLDKKSTILANPTQFHQIIMNLCTNAHHAMKDNGGQLRIQLERCTGNAKAAHDPINVKLTISDTGCGMDEDTAKRIFDPYFTTKDKDLGTGLGLSVVRKIVDDCKGQISVFTHPGHGTRFELLFPEAGGLDPMFEDPDLEIGKGSGNILFVDDENDIAVLGVTLLQRLGYTASSSTHPLEALELIKNNPFAFDMVISDITMPKLTGIRLAQALKKIRPNLPIILCTGFNQSEFEGHIPDHTIDAILKKPVGLRDLALTIARL